MEKYDSFENQISSQGKRWTICFVILFALMILAIVISLASGSVMVRPRELFSSEIVRQIRLPRVLMAAVLGGALAVSGFLLQTFFSNPLAGPYVLGISSASKVTVAIAMIFFIGNFGYVSRFVLVGAAFAGALAATGAILAVSHKLHHIASLLVVGIMIGYVCQAICEFVVTFADEQDIVNLHDWSVGSFSGSSMTDFAFAAVITAIAVGTVLFFCRELSAFRLGEDYAKSAGVNVLLLKRVIICISALLSATVTAFAGPISFVGIAVPILTKKIFATSKPAIVVPATFMAGAVFCMVCDYIARMIFAPVELAISSVTAILGAPVVIVVMIKRNIR